MAYTAEQHALFVQAFQALKTAGHEPALVHCDNSAGVMYSTRNGRRGWGHHPLRLRPQQRRPLRAVPPGDEAQDRGEHGQGAAAGATTSYGRRFTAKTPTKIATLCAGYADGYPRLLSCGQGIVEIHGKPCPVVGRVCMDQLMVDVTNVPDVHEDDEAILWGGAVSDSAEDVPARPIPFPTRCSAAWPAGCPGST